MASPQPLLHSTEVSCSPSRDGVVSVRIISTTQRKLQPASQHSVGALAASAGDAATGVSRGCKNSICSLSSGAPGLRRRMLRSFPRHRRIPQLFERSSSQFWNPRFDSPILEKACKERYFPQVQRRFRYVLFYLAMASVLWGVYFAVNSARCDPVYFLVPTFSFLLFCLLLFVFTFTRHYTRLYSQASLLLSIAIFALTLAPQFQTAGSVYLETTLFNDGNVAGSTMRNKTFRLGDIGSPTIPCISPVGTFSLCMEFLLLIYSLLHVRLYASVLMGLVYTALFEGFGWMHLVQWNGNHLDAERDTLQWLLPAKGLLHFCAHAIGIHLVIMSVVRSRSIFLKVGQAIMHGKELEVEKALKERMIHSVMPRSVADELMKQGDEETETSTASSSLKGNKKMSTAISKGQIIFRPFTMTRMESVSILFADIVGFTKMSANKTAHALVTLLNDLFGRFDRLCEVTCCEKISTLGDCYYCVAGCPEPRPDHAYCCIEMGLGMIQAIEQFCQEKRERVYMRVGVHTGTVLCGILGMKRFKFDVWSNDVHLANLMEQLGVAGKVHISQATANFLDDRYVLEDGEVMKRVGQTSVTDKLKGMKTYLIPGRQIEPRPASTPASEPTLAPSSRVFSETTGMPTFPRRSARIARLAAASQAASQKWEETRRSLASLSAVPCTLVASTGDKSVQDRVMVQNGCQDERRSSSCKIPLGRNSLVVNGLLSPRLNRTFRCSEASLCEMLQEKEKKRSSGAGEDVIDMDHPALIPLRSKNFRERSDTHFVEVIKEDSLMKDYFFKPPLSSISLCFLEKSLEADYRSNYKNEVKRRAPIHTFASPTFSNFLDVLLSCAVFLALTLACFLRSMVVGEAPALLPVILASVVAVMESLSLVASICIAFFLDNMPNCMQAMFVAITGWIPRHMIGALRVCMPAMIVFSHISCDLYRSVQFTIFICCAIIISIIQYCNFCHLSFWMRSLLATTLGVMLLVLLYHPLCTTDHGVQSLNRSGDETNAIKASTSPINAPWWPHELLGHESMVSFFLLLMLVWFLNREFEVTCRLHYHGSVEADHHRIKIQNMRDQADWLLGNIIPMHVAEQLKVTQSYSKNHDNVAVIFASIVNFSDFYEESFEGGKECYRVLNELIGDFDELLNRRAYSSIEKIKTIGATYMAASGLNLQQGGKQGLQHAHLGALFEFGLDMMQVVDDFNKNMLGFNFKMRIGFNHGPITAGVIGTTKLLYDIWGDTVNIASRMDSTGVECRVQVSEESNAVLSRMGYQFHYRGTVNVKGKGLMKTFLYPKNVESVPQLALSALPVIDAAVGGCSPTEERATVVHHTTPKVQHKRCASVPERNARDPRKEEGKDEGEGELTKL